MESQESEDRGDRSGLTPREWSVIELVAEGMSTKQVAYHLGISGRTVDKHVERVLRKLGAQSRLQAVALLLRGSVSSTHLRKEEGLTDGGHAS